MNSRKLLYVILVVLFLAGCAGEAPPVEVIINGRGALIMEAKSGDVLFEKNADTKYPPASTTKLMTAIVAVENASLRKNIVPTAKAVHVEPTVAGLKPGVKYRLKDLLASILIKSANDSAVVIAEAIAGSEGAFAKKMNDKAKAIGMTNTYFATASGLPTGKKDSQYTTARDLAKMMRYARRHKVLLDLMSKKEMEIYGSDKKRIYLKSHNKALFSSPDAPWGKTGYTRQARRTFVGSDPSLRPKIVFGLLKSNDLWKDINTLKDRGLEIYVKKHSTFLTDLIEWIKAQRRRGKDSWPVLLSLSY